MVLLRPRPRAAARVVRTRISPGLEPGRPLLSKELSSSCATGACKAEHQMIWADSRIIEASCFFPREVQHELHVPSQRVVIN